MGEHIEPIRSTANGCAVAIRLINLGWFRVGVERYAKTSEPTASRR